MDNVDGDLRKESEAPAVSLILPWPGSPKPLDGSLTMGQPVDDVCRPPSMTFANQGVISLS